MFFPEIVTSFKGLNSKCMATFKPKRKFKYNDFEPNDEKDNKLLEYVILVANNFFYDYDDMYDPACQNKLPSPHVGTFKMLYNNGELERPVSSKQYMNNDNIQKYLEKTGLDSEKFWYLLLFVYNYCHSTCKKGYRVESRTKDEFEKAMKYLKENFCHPGKRIRREDLETMEHRDVSITIKKKGKEAITISQEKAIFKLINWDAIMPDDDFLKFDSSKLVDDGKRLFAFYFDKYINWLLEQKETLKDKGKVKRRIHFIEDLLVFTKVIEENDMALKFEREKIFANTPPRDRMEWLRDIRRKGKEGDYPTVTSSIFM